MTEVSGPGGTPWLRAVWTRRPRKRRSLEPGVGPGQLLTQHRVGRPPGGPGQGTEVLEPDACASADEGPLALQGGVGDPPPPWTGPTTWLEGMRTSVRNTSLKWATPSIWRSGRMSMPGLVMSTRKKVIPRCFGTSGSVRARRMAQSLCWASEVHTFCPFTTQVSPSGSARVRRPARSDPAPGSLNSWHQTSSPRRMARRWSDFCSSVPHASSVGPTIPTLTDSAPPATSKRASSWLTIAWSIGVPPRPPYSAGQVTPAQPPSNSFRCHSWQARTCSACAAGDGSRHRRRVATVPVSRGAAFCSSQARTAARTAASSGVSSKSTCTPIRTDGPPPGSPAARPAGHCPRPGRPLDSIHRIRSTSSGAPGAAPLDGSTTTAGTTGGMPTIQREVAAGSTLAPR